MWHLIGGRGFIEEIYARHVLYMGDELSSALPFSELLVSVHGITDHAERMGHLRRGSFNRELTAVS